VLRKHEADLKHVKLAPGVDEIRVSRVRDWRDRRFACENDIVVIARHDVAALDVAYAGPRAAIGSRSPTPAGNLFRCGRNARVRACCRPGHPLAGSRSIAVP
jgi:hypothetical protein